MANNKSLKEVLDFLGDSYSVQKIDGMPTVYRKLNDYYDIEIDGCQYKNTPYRVYVWDIRDGMDIKARLIEQSGPIDDLHELKRVLDDYVRKYTV
ncbi:MAG: hypothetical protein K6T39_01430 [Anoxybacillus ayderensis]|nr:hypothetical protein [Anoxybacillus ayderensis]